MRFSQIIALLALTGLMACSHDSKRENPLDAGLSTRPTLAVASDDTAATATLSWSPFAGPGQFARYVILRNEFDRETVDTREFPQFWQSRQVSSREVAIRMPPPGDEVPRARDLLDQIGISGEIEKISSRVEVANPGLDVRVVRPGRITDIKANFQVRQATIETIQTNNWGVIHWLHHFTGVRMDRPEMRRHWTLTYLWSLAMDAVCGGLIFLVGSSLFMWYPMIRKRPLGWGFLGVGILGCCLFVIELSWLF